MASFSTVYGLCSLIDQKGLLGVETDEDGCAVISLGKNIVIRCRLSDQKQIASWSSSVKLTSEVVYDKLEELYTGVFDSVFIKQWSKTEASLEKIKKYKCSTPVFKILRARNEGGRLVILHQNGATVGLNYFLQNNVKELSGFLDESASILTAYILEFESGVFLVVVSRLKNATYCHSVNLDPVSLEVQHDSIVSVRLWRQDARVLGQTVLHEEESATLQTYWSDGFLFSLKLPLEPGKGDVNPGKFFGSVKTISCKSDVAMVAISKDHFVLYAGNASEEGAVLGMYNVNFGMMQAQTYLKMLNKPPRVWVVEDRVVLAMGQRLVCVPFTIQTESLAALLGTRCLTAVSAAANGDDDIVNVVPTSSWELPKSKQGIDFSTAPPSVRETIETHAAEGWAELSMCQALLTQLLDKHDMAGVTWCLENLINVPADMLARLAEVALKDRNLNLLEKVLVVPVDKAALLDKVRSHLSFSSCLEFLKYLTECLSNACLDKCLSLLLWSFTLLDAFYQQIRLSRDPAVEEAILDLRTAISLHIEALEESAILLPLLYRLKNGQSLANSSRTSSVYVLERIKIYD